MINLKGNLKNQMTLILIIQIALVIVLMTGTIQVYQSVTLNRLEEEYVQERIELVKGALNNELIQLSRTASDYATWDEAYQFSKYLNWEYIETNFTYESIENINIDGFLFLNSEKEVFVCALKTGNQLAFHKETVLSEIQLEKIRTAIDGKKEKVNVTGYLHIDEAHYMFALRPILRSDATGDEGGYLILLKVMDQEMMATLNLQYQMSIQIIDQMDNLVDENDSATRDKLASKIVLKDILDEPFAVIEVQVERTLRRIANEGMNTSLMVMILGLLIYGVFLYNFWNWKVLHRLTRLRAEVLDLKEGKQLSVQNIENREHPDEIEVLRIEIARMHDKTMKQRDILVLKHLELVEANSTLEDKINQRTEEIQAINNKLAEQEARYRTIVSEFPGFIFTHDREGRFLSCEGALQNELLYPKEAFIGKRVEDIFTNELADRLKLNIHQCLDTNEMVNFQYSLVTNSKKHDYEAKLMPLGTEEVISFITDVTEINKNMSDIEYLSYHDQLTGLYNRRFLAAEYSRINTSRNLPLSVVAIDVDGLKLVNDTFGHAFGDQLLCEIGAAIKESLRADDFVARMGGDEFAVLLPQADETSVHLLMNRISDQVSQIEICGVKASVSLGSFTSKVTSLDLMEIIKYADEQMYKDKLIKSDLFRYRALHSMCATLEKCDKGKSLRKDHLQHLALAIAKQLNMTEEEMTQLEAVLKFCDVGVIAIDEATRLKETAYLDEEMREMQRHSEIGSQLIKTIDAYRHLADSILHHHERWDGTGYPQGLKGTDIPLLSRITLVVNAYCAMTHERTYAEVKTKQEALDEMMSLSGTQFDPAVVAALVEIERVKD